MAVSTTFDTYPTTIYPAFNIQSGDVHKTIVTPFESGVESRNTIWRWSKRAFALQYNYISTANRHTLHDFYRNQRGAWKPFWFVDFETRDWEDEFCGYGGPLDVDGALQDDGGTFTDYTDEATEATHDDVLLLPAVPANDDAFYIGHNMQFNKATITIHDSGAHGQWTGTWQYRKSDNTWANLAGVTDGTVGGAHNSAFCAAAGDVDVTFTIPTDWIIYEREDRYLYWIRCLISGYNHVDVQPTATQIWVTSSYFDTHMAENTALTYVYIDGVSVAYANADNPHYHYDNVGPGTRRRIYFHNAAHAISYPAVGTLITCDGSGQLVILARFKDDNWKESVPFNDLFNVEVGIQEILET